LDDWLLAFCQRNGTNEVSRREIQRQGPGSIRKKSRLENALKELKELFRVKEVKRGRKRLIVVDDRLLLPEFCT
jgi:L-fucose isomerase-like protein